MEGNRFGMSWGSHASERRRGISLDYGRNRPAIVGLERGSAGDKTSGWQLACAREAAGI